MSTQNWNDLLKRMDRLTRGGFRTWPPPRIVVYVDGSCLNNGQPGARAGIGMDWGEGPEASLMPKSERLPGAEQTNNRAELYGVIRCLELHPDPAVDIMILTDSKYAILCLNHVTKWATNGWKTSESKPLTNIDLLKRLLECLLSLPCKVHPMHVPGHTDSPGDNKAHDRAQEGARMPAVSFGQSSVPRRFGASTEVGHLGTLAAV